MRTTILQIPTVALHPHPANPRRDLGVADLAKLHGILPGDIHGAVEATEDGAA